MDAKPASPRMAYLLAQAERYRRQAASSRNPAAADALNELAIEFEAEAALQAACDDLLKRRAVPLTPSTKPGRS